MSWQGEMDEGWNHRQTWCINSSIWGQQPPSQISHCYHWLLVATPTQSWDPAAFWVKPIIPVQSPQSPPTHDCSPGSNHFPLSTLWIPPSNLLCHCRHDHHCYDLLSPLPRLHIDSNIYPFPLQALQDDQLTADEWGHATLNLSSVPPPFNN